MRFLKAATLITAVVVICLILGGIAMVSAAFGAAVVFAFIGAIVAVFLVVLVWAAIQKLWRGLVHKIVRKHRPMAKV